MLLNFFAARIIWNIQNLVKIVEIGEKDAVLSAKDKMIARFTMERMKNTV